MDSNIKNELEDQSKKSYHSPELTTYGNIREITQAIGNMGDMDNPTGSTKTGFS